MKAQNGDTVKVYYKGTLDNGEVFDSNFGGEPLEFDLGAGQMIEGFEKAVYDMEKDESKTVKISAGQAYGEINTDYILTAGRDKLPEDLIPEIGMPLMMPTPEGEPIQVIIKEFDDESITLDANHPLAGKDLTFEIEVAGILRM
ncbi:peptidylprolyl isomerase [Candidatus Kapabacteria bacterium]|nr:peptidylprolyl isomerase [Candidatus Kapabacteria bacterium]